MVEEYIDKVEAAIQTIIELSPKIEDAFNKLRVKMKNPIDLRDSIVNAIDGRESFGKPAKDSYVWHLKRREAIDKLTEEEQTILGIGA